MQQSNYQLPIIQHSFPIHRLLRSIVFGLLLLPIACQQSTEVAEATESLTEKINNFSLYDQDGKAYELYQQADAKAVVFFIHGNACPIVRNAIPDLKGIRADYASKGIRFFMLNANLQDDQAAIKAEATEFDMDFPIWVDEAQEAGAILTLKRTAEAIVLNPETWTIIYRGPISDRIGYESQRPEATKNYLRDALDAHLAGALPTKQYRRGKGCLISFPKKR